MTHKVGTGYTRMGKRSVGHETVVHAPRASGHANQALNLDGADLARRASDDRVGPDAPPAPPSPNVPPATIDLRGDAADVSGFYDYLK